MGGALSPDSEHGRPQSLSDSEPTNKRPRTQGPSSGAEAPDGREGGKDAHVVDVDEDVNSSEEDGVPVTSAKSPSVDSPGECDDHLGDGDDASSGDENNSGEDDNSNEEAGAVDDNSGEEAGAVGEDADDDSLDGILSSDGDDESLPEADVAAFRMELMAHLDQGRTMVRAVQLLFGDELEEGGGDVPEPNSSLPRQVAIVAQVAGLAKPVLAALKSDDDLCKPENVNDVAQLCAAMYRLAETDIKDAVQGGSRPRLDLGISGIDDVAKLVGAAERVVVLSGAGVSVSCGIPDFRSKGGVYETVLKRYGLDDPQAIFDLTEFRMDPTLFYSFAKDIMPSDEISPSATHHFIAELDRRGKLLRNYSQNIDGLEHRAGISSKRVVLCHGSFHTATCMKASCRKTVSGSAISVDVKCGKVPICRECLEKPEEDEEDEENEWRSVMKPDIVFFGESLPKSVSENLREDVKVADLVLVLGTSLQVAPVARIPQQFEPQVPRILVNRELVGYSFDVELLGNCDSVVEELCRILDWSPLKAEVPAAVGKSPADGETPSDGVPVKFLPPRMFVFPGAIQDDADSVELGDESESASDVNQESDGEGADNPGLASLYARSVPVGGVEIPLGGEDVEEACIESGSDLGDVLIDSGLENDRKLEPSDSPAQVGDEKDEKQVGDSKS